MRKLQKKDSNSYSVKPTFLKFLKVDQNVKGTFFESITHKKGDVFSFRYLNQDGFYFILSGLVKLEIVNPTPRILRLCRPGDMVGYGSWQSPASAKYRLVALQDCHVQFWTKNGFFDLQKKNPEVSELLIQHLIQIILHKDERISALESVSVETRVIHLIVWLARQFGRKFEDGILLDIQLERDSMAQLAGTIPVTLSRVLTNLEDEKLIRRRRRQIIVLDLKGLSERL